MSTAPAWNKMKNNVKTSSKVMVAFCGKNCHMQPGMKNLRSLQTGMACIKLYGYFHRFSSTLMAVWSNCWCFWRGLPLQLSQQHCKRLERIWCWSEPMLGQWPLHTKKLVRGKIPCSLLRDVINMDTTRMRGIPTLNMKYKGFQSMQVKPA